MTVGAVLFRTPAGDLRAPWRIALFGVVLAVVGVAVTAIGFSVASATPLTGWARQARLPLDQFAITLSVLVATWVTGRMGDGGTGAVWTRVGLGRAAWRIRPVALCAVIGALVVALPTLAMVTGGAIRFEPATATDSAFTTAWAAFALMLPAAVSEEALVRGYVFTACRDGMGTSGAVIVTSVAFGLAHLANPDPTALSLVAVACAGGFLAIVRVVTGSLVAAIAAHLAFNLTQSVALHAPVSGVALQTPGYRAAAVGPDWLTGGPWGPEGGVGVIVALALASFLLITVARKRQMVVSTELLPP